ncbi:hypothetical protein BXZ70DRAFT_418648 [Cristinia sonorae]|uniref:Pentatricopeptide repeat-containing protein n=1 Tax=Cristinia sonorae TaxID=1940300 RepID=A0A8K0XUF8_9AGAR|nr:hypothetical protein BXZ70DRAFT_418648 [Cristinia sonorae]
MLRHGSSTISSLLLKPVGQISRIALYSSVTNAPSRATRTRRERHTRQPRDVQLADDHPPKLEPFVLGKRLSRLCQEGDLELAIKTLQTSPRDAQNVVVWNMMMTECLRANKYKTAYGVYTDMKKRGIPPSFATYATMLNGYSQCMDISQFPRRQEQAHKLWDSFQTWVEQLQERNSPELRTMNSTPVTAYIRILGNAHLHDKLLEVLHDLPITGPLAPTAHTYTAIFRVIQGKADSAESRLKTAADARFMWQSMQRAEGRNKIHVDSHLLAAVLRILSAGGPEDYNFAFGLIHDYIGLRIPGNDARPPPQQVSLSLQLVQTILQLTNNVDQPLLCVQWLETIMSGKMKVESGHRIPEPSHIQQGLLAYSRLAAIAFHKGVKPSGDEATKSLKLLEHTIEEEALHSRPGAPWTMSARESMFETAMTTCLFSEDWRTATRVFKLMSGYDMADFADGRVGVEPKRLKGAYVPSVRPNVITMGILARLSVQHGDPSLQRQCVRAMSYFGSKLYHGFEDKFPVYSKYYLVKLGEAVLKLDRGLKEDALVELNEENKQVWDELVAWLRSRERMYNKLRWGGDTPSLELGTRPRPRPRVLDKVRPLRSDRIQPYTV